MDVAVYLSLVAAAVLGVVAPWVARVVPPAAASRLLTGAALLAAAATTFVLGVLAFTLVAQAAPVAALGSWSVVALEAADPVPEVLSSLAAFAVLVLTVLGVRWLVGQVRATLAARRLCAVLGGQGGDLLVVDDADQAAGGLDVFAVPARQGRIVATRRLLAVLPAAERRAVLAHEAAHLRHHHHGFRLAAGLAAAVNPLLRPVASAVAYTTERWADETAATETGDRALVARALARAGIGRLEVPGSAWAAAAMALSGNHVVRRIRALVAPPPRRQPAAVVATVVLLATTAVAVAAAAEAQRDTERLFETASQGTTVAAGVSPAPDR